MKARQHYNSKQNENGELTDAEKFADVVDKLAGLCDVVFVAYHHDLFHRKHSQPVSDERVVYPNAHANLQSDQTNIQNLLSEDETHFK